MADAESIPTAARGKPGGNIYMILMFVSLAALVTATGIMWYMNTSLTGQGNPLVVERK